MRLTVRAALVLMLVSCGGGAPAPAAHPPAEAAPAPVVLTVIGTNDLHGHLAALPVLGGYLSILRAQREAEGGGVVLLDGGDMFQGTLESNLVEGAPVVEAYAALGYDAVTIGNHEFDYGPVGERATVGDGGGDPRGALLARAAEANYPFLSANLLVRETGEPIDWDHVAPSHVFERAGLSIGVIGVTTEDTLSTTIFANVSDLAMQPLADAIAREAASLRGRGVDVVLVAAHAGGRCLEHDDPHDLSSCDAEQEIHGVAEALPEGAVDAIVAGHTHQAMSHVVNGIPVIESYSYGRAFGRVDLTVDPIAHRVIDARLHPPRDMCESGSADDGDCLLATYEGAPIEPDAVVAGLVAPALDNALAARQRELGVTLVAEVTRSRERECALGNLVTDLMRAARPDADIALTNGGGLRADLPEGALTYGAYYESSPFDNRFAFVEMTAADLRAIIAENLRRSGSFFSFSGIEADARCNGDELEVRVRRAGGRALRDDERLTMVTTDFLATGRDGALGDVVGRDGAVRIEDGDAVRDIVVEHLTSRGGQIDPSSFFDPAHPRVRYPGERPVSCE